MASTSLRPSGSCAIYTRTSSPAISTPRRSTVSSSSRRFVSPTAHAARNDAVCFQIASWHPSLVGKQPAQILAHAFSMADARETIAREYGFYSWSDVPAGRHSNVPFEHAVNTMLSGDLAAFKTLIRESPALVREPSQYGHRATLLHYTGTNGVESYRQIVPLNLAEIVDLLLTAGADASIKAAMYGGATPRHLFETSKHSYDSGVHEAVVAVYNKHESARSG